MLEIADASLEERAKYTEIWTDVPDYRLNSPGMAHVPHFLSIMNPPARSSIATASAVTRSDPR